MGGLMLGGTGCKSRINKPINENGLAGEGEFGDLSGGMLGGIGDSSLTTRMDPDPVTGMLKTASGDTYYLDDTGTIVGMQTRWGSWGVDLSGNPLGVETANVLFAFDSSQVTEIAKLQAVNGLMSEPQYAAFSLIVEGHCDERGTEEYNIGLGERRALAVREQLMNLGVSGSRITSLSFGEQYPLDPRSTEDAYRKNRRAVFVVTQ
jgi:outer membrane protein OmpA-like peptidoglycan-associated protein